jgi:hypothetical protein
MEITEGKNSRILGYTVPSEADHSPPYSAEAKEWVELYLHSPIHLHGVVLRENFTFVFTQYPLI